MNYQAVRGQLLVELSPDLEINLSADYTTDRRNSPAGVLTFADYRGPGFIDPYGSGARYDARFICGRFCNYASFQSPAQAGPLGPLSPNGYQPSQSRDEVDLESYGFSGTIDWTIADDLALKRLKKRKLRIKDMVAYLENQLIPDLDA